MPKNRTIAFGYKIKSGEVVTEPQQSAVVAQIFAMYLGGKGLKYIADYLNDSGAAQYNEGKQWNKNMIDRLIACDKYIGRCGYPSLVSKADFDKANRMKFERYKPKRKPKTIRQAAQTIFATRKYVPSIEITKYQNELARQLGCAALNTQQITAQILRGAALRYACCTAENEERQ